MRSAVLDARDQLQCVFCQHLVVNVIKIFSCEKDEAHVTLKFLYDNPKKNTCKLPYC